MRLAHPLHRVLRRFLTIYRTARRTHQTQSRPIRLLILLLILLLIPFFLLFVFFIPPSNLVLIRLSFLSSFPTLSFTNSPHPLLTDPHALQSALNRLAFTPSSLLRSHPTVRLAVVTAVNYPFRNYLHNLFCSMRRHAPISAARTLVVSMDHHMQDHATANGFHSLLLPPPSPAASAAHSHNVHAFGSSSFNILSKQKLYAVYLILRAGVDVLFTDADIVWCADAAHSIAKQVYHDYTRSPDLLMQTAWPRSLLNSGFYYARSNPDTIALFEAFMTDQTSNTENDQTTLNRVLCRTPFGGELLFYNDSRTHPSAPHRPLPRLCRWNHRTEARVLDATRYPTGGEIIDGKKLFHHPRARIMSMCETGSVDVLHNNCILSQRKQARFIVKGIWWVDEDGMCRRDPAPATLQARRTCGLTKCGPEGDYRRFVKHRRPNAHTV